MATNLVKATDETSYRARADRSIQSGRVISIDTLTHTAIVDVGMVDNNGAGVYLEDVPFSPQSPPHTNDTIALLRTNSSPYSMVIGSGAQVGGANSGQVVNAGGAVSSIKKTGEATGQQGDVTLDPGTGMTITRTGKTFTHALADTAVTPGVYTNMNATVDQQGRITAAANGAAGAPTDAHYVTTQAESGLSAEVNLGALASGLLLGTVSAGVSTISSVGLDTDGTLAANSDTKVASQKAVKTYADALIAANDAMVFKGVIDCSANPNYPAADAGHTYRVSVAGKIGGASGVNVEVADLLLCITDGTVSGNQATVGSHWTIVQANLDGAVIGPASAVSADFATFSGTSGKLIQDSGVSLDTDGTLTANSDTRIASQKAIKTYAQPLDSDLTTIAGLTATTDNFLQSKSAAWASRTPAQVTADLIAVVGDSGSGGTKGLVPAPASGDAALARYLKSDGTWASANISPYKGIMSGLTAYTLVASDAGKMLGVLATSNSTITVPTNASVPYPSGTIIYIFDVNGNSGAGGAFGPLDCQIVGDTGVTVNGFKGRIILDGRFGRICLYRSNTADDWYLFGDLR